MAFIVVVSLSPLPDLGRPLVLDYAVSIDSGMLCRKHLELNSIAMHKRFNCIHTTNLNLLLCHW